MRKDLENFLENVRRTLKVATKPSSDEIWLMFKVTFLGFMAVGAIGFLFQLAGAMISGTATFAP
jgi:protein translocase SEC61 complex gamma subunit